MNEVDAIRVDKENILQQSRLRHDNVVIEKMFFLDWKSDLFLDRRVNHSARNVNEHFLYFYHKPGNSKRLRTFRSTTQSKTERRLQLFELIT